VNTGKLAPIGWHVPADSEWTVLTTFLGGASVAGGKLKEAGLAHWLAPNTGATNATGFSALPGGYRHYDGSFHTIGVGGNWWSTTADDPEYTWGRGMSYIYASLDLDYGYIVTGFSVRCVRDH
jgi:uncharacterized protein (TIGR02145 family)